VIIAPIMSSAQHTAVTGTITGTTSTAAGRISPTSFVLGSSDVGSRTSQPRRM